MTTTMDNARERGTILETLSHGGCLFAPVEELIHEAKNGRMVVLADSEDPDNFGRLFVPAQMVTPDVVNFMARFGRGLVCLALTRARVAELALPMMTRRAGTSTMADFTVSIEARSGVSTGISAADRARTIAVAADAANGADDLVTPGHVFPLVAEDGGVLIRAGWSEAAIDLARLAGLAPSGVLCQVMSPDGSVAGLDELGVLARQHNLKMGNLQDLIAYRLRKDYLVERVREEIFTSDYGGDWRFIVFRNRIDGSESYALQKGEPTQETLVRVHRASLLSDMLGRPGLRNRALQRAMGTIGEAGAGIIVVLASPLAFDPERADGQPLRSYGIGAQILAELGIEDMILLSNSEQPAIAGLTGFGLRIVERRGF